MSVEDDPKYNAWREVLERLITVTEAHKNGVASEQDLNEAKLAFKLIADTV